MIWMEDSLFFSLFALYLFSPSFQEGFYEGFFLLVRQFFIALDQAVDQRSIYLRDLFELELDYLMRKSGQRISLPLVVDVNSAVFYFSVNGLAWIGRPVTIRGIPSRSKVWLLRLQSLFSSCHRVSDFLNCRWIVGGIFLDFFA